MNRTTEAPKLNIDELSTDELQAILDKRKADERNQQDANRVAYENLRNSTTVNLVKRAIRINRILAAFKDLAFGEAQTVWLLLQEYSARHNDGKGNFTIEHEDCRITYKRQGKPSFDERSHQAEKHIIDFLNSKFQDDNDTREMIMAFLERKNGNLDINLIQKLYQFEDRYDDPNFKKGIKLLKESYSYNHSKDYINFEHRDDKGEWHPIVLQFSKV